MGDHRFSQPLTLARGRHHDVLQNCRRDTFVSKLVHDQQRIDAYNFVINFSNIDSVVGIAGERFEERARSLQISHNAIVEIRLPIERKDRRQISLSRIAMAARSACDRSIPIRRSVIACAFDDLT